MPFEPSKKAAGEKAAEFIENGMVVGLGTGSTAAYFIEKLIARCKSGLQISAVATSQRSLEQAKKGGIPLVDVATVTTLDICVDGADEVDPNKQLIKGAGAALFREKIVASMSREMVVIIDESKLVPKLGTKSVPVEISSFCSAATLYKLKQLGYDGTLRLNDHKIPQQTDNGNLLVDLHLLNSPLSPAEHHDRIRSVPGVVETGFFLNMAGRIVIGFADGQVLVH